MLFAVSIQFLASAWQRNKAPYGFFVRGRRYVLVYFQKTSLTHPNTSPFPTQTQKISHFSQFSNDTFPITDGGDKVDPREWNGRDGFSPLPMISAYLADATRTGCASHWDIGISLEASSPTVLLDATTGERVAHWVEMDHSSDSWEGDYERMMIVWPARRLEDGKRYVVGMSEVVDVNGERVQSSDAFGALRDGTPSNDPDVEAQRSHYESSIFPLLTSAGVSRDRLQLAWDFTVASETQTTGDMMYMRDDALAKVSESSRLRGASASNTAGAVPPASKMAYTITSVKENPQPFAARQIEGTFEVPLYLTSAEPGLDVRLTKDASGNPVARQNATVNFLAIVPNTAVGNASSGGVRLMQYGHGLFGSREEITTSYLVEEANTYGYVLIATDWWGLSSSDEVVAGIMVATSLSDFPFIPDRLHQGVLNGVLAVRLALTQLVNDPAFQSNGKSVIDPTKRSYYGNSCGGIMGGVMMAVAPDISRGVLGVPGAPFSLLLPRSVDFAALFDVIRLRFANPLDRIALMTVLGDRWAALAPEGYLHRIVDPFPNTPAHQIAVHYGLGDAQVTWLGAQTMARSINAINATAMFDSNTPVGNSTFFGFDISPSSKDLNGASFIQGWDFGVPLANIPFTNNPADKSTDTHEGPRRQTTAQQQTSNFLQTGTIHNYCSGPCKGTM